MLILLVILHDRFIVFSVLSGYQTESSDVPIKPQMAAYFENFLDNTRKHDGKYLVRTMQYVNTDPQTGRFRSSGG